MPRLPAALFACVGLIPVAAHGAEVALCPSTSANGRSALIHEFFSAEGEPLRLHLSDIASEDPACVSVSLDAPASEVLWMEPAPAGLQGDLPERLSLQGRFMPERAQVSEIIPHGSEAPSPASSAPPAPSGATRRSRPLDAAGRAAWIWSPDAWKRSPETIWALRAREGVTSVYVTIPVGESGEVDAPDSVRAFVAAARARGVSVWAVVGDPRDVLPESAPALQRRMRAYAFYNRYAPPESRLAGVQLDIEPYLLPGFALSPDHWRERYLETVLAARAAAEGLPLDLVMPVWWGAHPAWGARVLEPLALDGVSLTVMNYRTDSAALRAGAAPFLAWGSRAGRPVRMALEAGPLPDEARRRYAAVANGAAGELWRVPGPRGPLFVLFKSPRAGLEGRAYAFESEGVFPATNLTFAGDLPRLRAAAEVLEREWRAWPAFAGIALHGLEEVRSEARP